MTASFGKAPEPPTGQATAAATTAEPKVSAELGDKKHYGKPALKRLGLLRSVTGSNLTW
jgi:hypothetical protein